MHNYCAWFNDHKLIYDDARGTYRKLLEQKERQEMKTTGEDSVGRSIYVGSKVRFRGHIYTVKAFHPGLGLCGSSQLSFEEPVHTDEIPDEIAVDLVEE